MDPMGVPLPEKPENDTLQTVSDQVQSHAFILIAM